MARLYSIMHRRALAAVSAVGLFVSLVVTPCQASESTAGYISKIIVTPDGIVVFNHSGTRSTVPACQGATVPARWAFNGATAAGQAKLAVLMSAYGLNKQISLSGTGACSEWFDTESVQNIVLE